MKDLKEVNPSNPKINYAINTGAFVRFDDTALFLVGCMHIYIYIYFAGVISINTARADLKLILSNLV